jgi:hypothetical protein
MTILVAYVPRPEGQAALDPDGHPNFPTFGHFKLPHPDERVTVQ